MPEMSLAALRGLLPQANPYPQGSEQWLRYQQMLQPQQQLSPDMRDNIERLPRPNIGYDRNAVQGDDLMRQYFLRGPVQEDI